MVSDKFTMNYSTKISERLWNLPDKGERESKREEIFIDDIIQKSHIEKELLSNLDDIETVFDGGAGCGRCSVLLAKKGCKKFRVIVIKKDAFLARIKSKKS